MSALALGQSLNQFFKNNFLHIEKNQIKLYFVGKRKFSKYSSEFSIGEISALNYPMLTYLFNADIN